MALQDYQYDISVVAPLYNEEESVEKLYEAIKATLDTMPEHCEIVFVDDGSKDNTFEIAKTLAESDPDLKIVKFKKNYGQTPAMAAGIQTALGKFIVTMDGDLQNDPSDIPMMLEEIKKGFDLVVGWRHNRQDKFVTRKLPSKIANWLIGKATGVPIKDNGCSLKVYRSDVMKAMPFYSEMHRFIPALLSISGATYSEVKVKHHARQFGESKYGLSRIYKVLLDLLMMKTILSLVRHPFRWFAKLSLVPFGFSLLTIPQIFMAASKGEGLVVQSGIFVTLLITGIFLFSLGLLTEQIYNRGSFQLKNYVPLTARRVENSAKSSTGEQ